MISVVLIGLLLISEVVNYWINPRVLKKAEISNDYESFNFVELNFDIIFENAPCQCKSFSSSVISVLLEQTDTTV